jgi:hypothetical protein
MPATFRVVEDTRKQRFVERLSIGDLRLTKTGVRVFEVFASEPVTAVQAKAASGVPAMASDFEADAGCWLTDRTTEVGDESPRTKWVITCSYSSELPQYGGSGGLVKSISYSSVSQEESYEQDRSSTPKRAVNTAGVPFAERPKRQRSLRVIAVAVEVPYTSTMATFNEMDDAINSDVINLDGVSYAAKSLLLSDLSLTAATMTGPTTGYKTLSFKLTHNRDTWVQKFESRGFKEKVDSVVKPIVDAQGVPVEEPYPLAANGTKLALSGTPSVVELQPYTALPMASLFA